MVNVIKFLLPLAAVFSVSYANVTKFDINELINKVEVPANYVLQDLELVKNNIHAKYEDYATLKYINNELNKLVDIPDNNNVIEKRGICAPLKKINYLAYLMCLAGQYDMGCLVSGGQKLNKNWACCSADCMLEPNEYCRSACFSTKGARPQCMGC